MKLLNRKSLILGVFLFQPFLATSANGPAGSCREAVENLATGEASSKEIKSAQQDISPKLASIEAVQKDLNSGNLTPSQEHLNEIWETVLFTLELQPIELARITKNLMQSERYNQPASYEIIQKLINENRELIRQEGIFDFPSELHLSQINNIHVGHHGMQVRRLPLIEAMDAENPKLVALLIGLGADVYVASPYNYATLTMLSGVVIPSNSSEVMINPVLESLKKENSKLKEVLKDLGVSGAELSHLPSRNYLTDFRIRYPIPLALTLFSANFDTTLTQQIVEILLEKSDSNFRYNHDKIDQSFAFFTEKMVEDTELIYGVRDGASDLMLVAQYGTAEMLKVLIERGHDINAKDKQGQGVQDYAQLNKKNKEEILTMLKVYKNKQKSKSSSNPARLDEDFVLGVSRLE